MGAPADAVLGRNLAQAAPLAVGTADHLKAAALVAEVFRHRARLIGLEVLAVGHGERFRRGDRSAPFRWPVVVDKV